MALSLMASREFSVGVLHGWRGVLLGLLGSGVFMVSGWQDSRPHFGIGCWLCFFIALYAACGVVWLGIGARIWGGALLGAAAFCLEVWLIWRWWHERGNKGREREA